MEILDEERCASTGERNKTTRDKEQQFVAAEEEDEAADHGGDDVRERPDAAKDAHGVHVLFRHAAEEMSLCHALDERGPHTRSDEDGENDEERRCSCEKAG